MGVSGRGGLAGVWFDRLTMNGGALGLLGAVGSRPPRDDVVVLGPGPFRQAQGRDGVWLLGSGERAWAVDGRGWP